MKQLTRFDSIKFANDDKYLMAFLFKNKLVVKKINMLKNVQEAEDQSGFKPPLFLIGIGMALLYQLFFRSKSTNKMPKQLTSMSKRDKGKAIGKNINDMYKFGKSMNR